MLFLRLITKPLRIYDILRCRLKTVKGFVLICKKTA